MRIQIDSRAYIETLLDYTITDVEYLLEKFEGDACEAPDGRRHAGPVLITVVSGIDTLGGVIYGFSQASHTRSVDFMEKYMPISTSPCAEKIPRPLAEFVYDSVRCGVTHHGMPKIGVTYQLWTDQEWKKMCPNDAAFCKDPAEGKICINVAKLARCYLAAVHCIQDDFKKNPKKYQASGLENEIKKAKKHLKSIFGLTQVPTIKKSYGESSTSANASGQVPTIKTPNTPGTMP